MGLVWGWSVFWFLTDDAFISFRYISNSFLGYGYVWNAPPFLPVEGYTSFLWVALLDMIWRLSGVEPPKSANVASLLFSFATLTLCSAMVMQLDWGERLKKWRVAFVALLLVFLIANRTFLAWTSSGLETAMFDFWVIAWFYAWAYLKSPVRRAAVGGLITSMLALSRPDGLLFMAAAIVMIGASGFMEPNRKQGMKIAVCGLLPLGIAAAHEAWRVRFYGEWLPNTYYAKYTQPWPEAGVLYFFSFVLEYALWIPALTGLVAGILLLKEASIRNFAPAIQTHALVIMALGTLFGQFAYYTFIIGGDHFEYRVYCQFLPLICIGFFWLLNRVEIKALPALAMVAFFVALSLPVPWTHWALTKDMNERKSTCALRKPIAPAWPSWARWYAAAFDKTQIELIRHFICVRHQEHKVFWLHQVKCYPSRAEGMKVSREGNPVCPEGCVGMPAWTLPNVNIIDTLGLNDYVVARTPRPKEHFRVMAHDRKAPDGYVKSFAPNTRVVGDKTRTVQVRTRPAPLTDEKIRQLEIFWRDKVKAGLKAGA